MRKSRFSDEQIIGILKEQEAGLPTAEVCRKHGISPGSFYKWKSKFGGLDISDAKRLRSLEGELRLPASQQSNLICSAIVDRNS